jgi:hypothetical protein
VVWRLTQVRVWPVASPISSYESPRTQQRQAGALLRLQRGELAQRLARLDLAVWVTGRPVRRASFELLVREPPLAGEQLVLATVYSHAPTLSSLEGGRSTSRTNAVWSASSASSSANPRR